MSRRRSTHVVHPRVHTWRIVLVVSLGLFAVAEAAVLWFGLAALAAGV